MREDLVENLSGGTAKKWIEDIPLSIEDDHVSLFKLDIISQGFGFTEEERFEFIRRCMRSLLDAGAVAVDLTGETYPLFKATTRWGTEREEIIEAIIADWQARGGGELDWGEYPFTWPENIGTV
ncbi:hypothetical protein [Aurantimonas sp. Leaf443]|uniref:hypothetical protein n=1 Tax=Aurantimonas sp. Leaf443 TaxID=1736378 RepID=UPI000B041511|nr:hypothetical protein [Aurantimonas sp. Leaf443]